MRDFVNNMLSKTKPFKKMNSSSNTRTVSNRNNINRAKLLIILKSRQVPVIQKPKANNRELNRI